MYTRSTCLSTNHNLNNITLDFYFVSTEEKSVYKVGLDTGPKYHNYIIIIHTMYNVQQAYYLCTCMYKLYMTGINMPVDQ